MAERKIGRYRIVGSNNHYVIGRWNSQEYRVMHSVPSYTTMKGAIRKAKSLHKKDLKDGIRVKI